MKFGSAILGMGLLTLGACTQVGVEGEVSSMDPVPPLTVLDTPPPVALQPIVAPEPAPAPVVVLAPTFADESPTDWTVQIAAVKSLEEIEQIEANSEQLSDTVHVPTFDMEHGDLHAVLVGVYETEAAAAEVAKALPPMVAGDEPWVRSVASVQAVMRR